MAGEGHTLYVESRGGKIIVEMASARWEWASRLIAAAIKEENKGQRRNDWQIRILA